MSASQDSAEIAALVPFIKGRALQLGWSSQATIPGTELIDRDAGLVYDSLGQYHDDSIDCLASVYGLETLDDGIKALREWRRVLREGAVLALVLRDVDCVEQGIRHLYTPAAITNLLCTVGGFRIDQFAKLEEKNAWLLVAEREAVLDVRMPFGLQGAALSQSVANSSLVRAELYFQVGTLMLRSGDPELAENCFRSLMELEPENSHAFFGLGMCLGTMQRWSEALTELQRCIAVDPNNQEAQRWAELAKSKLAQAPVPGQPAPASPAATTISSS